MSAAITFDDFIPGAVLGDDVQTFDATLGERWRAIFGDEPAAGAGAGAGAGAEAASMAIVLMMRSYLQVVAPRPPGNVHARQRFSLLGLPKPGESIRTVVSCAGKELRRGRRYVELRVEGSGEGRRPVFTGQLTLIWAA